MGEPTYEDVLRWVAALPEGTEINALHSHFVREADQGRYDFGLISSTRRAVGYHVSRALDRGELELGKSLRLIRKGRAA